MDLGAWEFRCLVHGFWCLKFFWTKGIIPQTQTSTSSTFKSMYLPTVYASYIYEHIHLLISCTLKTRTSNYFPFPCMFSTYNFLSHSTEGGIMTDDVTWHNGDSRGVLCDDHRLICIHVHTSRSRTSPASGTVNGFLCLVMKVTCLAYKRGKLVDTVTSESWGEQNFTSHPCPTTVANTWNSLYSCELTNKFSDDWQINEVAILDNY